jgi:hypothetical protein
MLVFSQQKIDWSTQCDHHFQPLDRNPTASRLLEKRSKLCFVTVQVGYERSRYKFEVSLKATISFLFLTPFEHRLNSLTCALSLSLSHLGYKKDLPVAIPLPLIHLLFLSPPTLLD